MDLSYDRSAIVNGNQLRRQAEERPPTFAEYNGATDAVPASPLDITSNNRKAGPMGMRALELMNNPEAAAATDRWMTLFGDSNQGAEFNASLQARLDSEAETQVMNEIAAQEARG